LPLENENDIRFLESLFRQSIAETRQTRDYTLEMLRSILDLILTTCSSRYKTIESSVSKGKGQILVKRFYQLVEENYLKNLSLADYAALLLVTPNHLTQTVKQFTGKTSIQVIKMKQILEIKRLLVHTNLNINEIAALLHFDDQSYFSKFFRRETKLSPLQYRSLSSG